MLCTLLMRHTANYVNALDVPVKWIYAEWKHTALTILKLLLEWLTYIGFPNSKVNANGL